MIDFGLDFGASWDPKGSPKGTQNGAQEAPKSRSKFDTKKDALRKPLGGLLGRSWADLGASWDRPRPQNRAVVHTGLVFLKIHFLSINASQEPSWTQLGATWEPKGSQKAPQKGTQDDQKRVPKTKQKKGAKKERKRPPGAPENLTQLLTESVLALWCSFGALWCP